MAATLGLLTCIEQHDQRVPGLPPGAYGFESFCLQDADLSSYSLQNSVVSLTGFSSPQRPVLGYVSRQKEPN